VRCVAACALCVRRNARAEHVQVLMARSTGNRARALEFVRPMTADAFGVAACKQRRRRHERVLFGVTFRARRACILRRSVLVLMAGRARRGDRFAGGRVRRLHVVAIVARRGLRLFGFVRFVTRYALARVMHDDGGGIVLSTRVAAAAVRGCVHGGGIVVRPGDREGVTRGAVRARGSSKTPARLLCGMLDARFLGMTRRAALRHHAADGVAGQLVAFAAGDPLSYDVHQVSADLPRRLPDGIHVHTSARRTPGPGRRSRFGTSRGQCEEQRAHEPSRGQMPVETKQQTA